MSILTYSSVVLASLFNVGCPPSGERMRRVDAACRDHVLHHVMLRYVAVKCSKRKLVPKPLLAYISCNQQYFDIAICSLGNLSPFVHSHLRQVHDCYLFIFASTKKFSNQTFFWHITQSYFPTYAYQDIEHCVNRFSDVKNTRTAMIEKKLSAYVGFTFLGSLPMNRKKVALRPVLIGVPIRYKAKLIYYCEQVIMGGFLCQTYINRIAFGR